MGKLQLVPDLQFPHPTPLRRFLRLEYEYDWTDEELQFDQTTRLKDTQLRSLTVTFDPDKRTVVRDLYDRAEHYSRSSQSQELVLHGEEEYEWTRNWAEPSSLSPVGSLYENGTHVGGSPQVGDSFNRALFVSSSLDLGSLQREGLSDDSSDDQASGTFRFTSDIWDSAFQIRIKRTLVPAPSADWKSWFQGWELAATLTEEITEAGNKKPDQVSEAGFDPADVTPLELWGPLALPDEGEFTEAGYTYNLNETVGYKKTVASIAVTLSNEYRTIDFVKDTLDLMFPFPLARADAKYIYTDEEISLWAASGYGVEQLGKSPEGTFPPYDARISSEHGWTRSGDGIASWFLSPDEELLVVGRAAYHFESNNGSPQPCLIVERFTPDDNPYTAEVESEKVITRVDTWIAGASSRSEEYIIDPGEAHEGGGTTTLATAASNGLFSKPPNGVWNVDLLRFECNIELGGTGEETEESEGAYIGINANNDNGSTVALTVEGYNTGLPEKRDFEVTTLTAYHDPEIVPVFLSVNAIGGEPPPGVNCRLRSVGGGRAEFRVWKDARKSEEIVLPKIFESLDDVPSDVYIEGVRESASPREWRLIWEVVFNDVVCASDTVAITITPVLSGIETQIIGVQEPVFMPASVHWVNRTPPQPAMCLTIANLNAKGLVGGRAGIVQYVEYLNHLSSGVGVRTQSGATALKDFRDPYFGKKLNDLGEQPTPLYLHNESEFPTYQADVDGTVIVNVTDTPALGSLPETLIPTSDPETFTDVDISMRFDVFAVWRFDDGTIYPLGQNDWSSRFSGRVVWFEDSYLFQKTSSHKNTGSTRAMTRTNVMPSILAYSRNYINAWHFVE